MPNTVHKANLNPPKLVLPFHSTHSERKIISELIEIGERRESGFGTRVMTPEFFTARRIRTATELIRQLEHLLFPQEMQLRQKRADFLKRLNGGMLRVHFDSSLETAALTIQARVQSAAEFDDLVRRLQSFNFTDWQRHCESERADAD